MGFRFKLERVRSYKASREKQLKQQLGEAYRRQEEAKKHLQYYRELRANSLLAEGAVEAEQLLQGAACLEALDRRIARQQEQLRLATQEVHKQRRKVQSAMQERKLLDRLRQNHLSAYRYQQYSAEQKQLDEVAANIYLRRQAD
ncbi:MAG: flagellar export protein FliJ [Clostridia bacterium]|nr:flagellar export protein FliJ [Clostridia bacterium]